MKRSLLLLTVLMAVSPPSWAQDKHVEAARFYKAGLAAYMGGDYDRAILLAVKAVQTDPASQKARDFLSVLVAEKQKVANTEIWISNPKNPEEQGHRVPVEFLWNQMEDLRKEVAVMKDVRRRENNELLQQFEQRVQIMASLLSRSSANQTAELKAAHERVYQALGATQDTGLKIAMMLFVLTLISLALSLAALMRRGRAKTPMEVLAPR